MHEYIWIAGLMRTLEVKFGPFWEPSRPRPATDYEGLVAMADEFEPLMRRLVTGRRKSFAILGVSTAVLASIFTAMWLVPDSMFVYVDVLFAVLFAATVMWFQFVCWREWFVLYYSNTLPPSHPAPPPSQIIDGLRLLSDGFTAAGDAVAIRALVAMREKAPLTYGACLRMTVASSAVQRAVRGA